MKQFLVVMMTVVLLGGCGDDSPTGDESNVDGVYAGGAGGVKNTLGGTQSRDTFAINLTVNGTAISGTLSALDGTGQVPVTGTVFESRNVAFTATDPCGNARYAFQGSITTASTRSMTMSGTWTQAAAAGCSGGSSGTFMARRQ